MRLSLVLRAVTTSWVAVIANACVGIFLTPYVLHRLGDEAFGVWVLTTNLVGYYGLKEPRFRAFLATLGLRKADGTPRKAWMRFQARAKEWTNSPDARL